MQAMLGWRDSGGGVFEKRGPKELRRWGRYEVQIRAEITLTNDTTTFRYYGQTLDISEGGLRVFIPQELEMGMFITMEFTLPYTSRSLTMGGVIRNRDSFTYGVEFVAVTIDQQQTIVRVCKTLELLQ
jgi:hypothetical protein